MAETLTQRVGDLLGITISTNTIPSTNMVNQWLLDGSIKFMMMAPKELLQNKYTPSALGSVSSATLPSDFLRMVHVKKSDNTPVTILDPKIGRSLQQSGFSLYPFAYIENNTIYFNATDNYSLLYIPQPVDSSGVPDEFHELIVNYALIMAKKQEGALDEVVPLLNEWYETVKSLSVSDIT